MAEKIIIAEVDKYFKQLEADKSKHTVRSYARSINRFLSTLNINTLEDLCKVDSGMLEDYVYDLKEELESETEETAANSANTHARAIMAFFGWMKKRHYMENEVKAELLGVKKTIKLVFTDDEVCSMIAVARGSKERAMIGLLAFTGIRCEELTKVKVSDIGETHVLINGKGGKQRKILIRENLRKILNEYLKDRNYEDSEFLFATRRNFGCAFDGSHEITTSSIRVEIKNCMARAGISEERIAKLSVHSFRRYFAVFLFRNNVPIKKIQLLMGHSGVNTTEIYLVSCGAEMADDEMIGLPDILQGKTIVVEQPIENNRVPVQPAEQPTLF